MNRNLLEMKYGARLVRDAEEDQLMVRAAAFELNCGPHDTQYCRLLGPDCTHEVCDCVCHRPDRGYYAWANFDLLSREGQI